MKPRMYIDQKELKKCCVISAVGKNSLHREWLKEEVDFDLHLIVYDDSYTKFYNDTAFISCQRGYKFKLVYDYLIKHPVYLEKYEYFYIPDDDILIDTDNISKLFKNMRQFALHIAQPALSDSYYTYLHTLKDKFCKLRYSNFVEMMTPCFSREALQKVLFTFNENNSGWGIEYHWSELIGFSGTEMAVIDDLHCVHTRPIQSNNPHNVEKLANYLDRYSLSREIREYGYIPAENYEIKSVLFKNRETYQIFQHHLDLVVNILFQAFYEGKIIQDGLNGKIGLARLFVLYYRLTRKKKYSDIADGIWDMISNRIGLLKDDAGLFTGLPGFCWYIEFLAQHEYIENATDEILEELCPRLNEQCSDLIDNCVSINYLIGFSQHYIARLNNENFKISNGEHATEKDYLNRLTDKIIELALKSREEKEIANTVLFLSQILVVMPEYEFDISQIKTLIRKLKENWNPDIFSPVYKNYVLVSVSEILQDDMSYNYTLETLLSLKIDGCDFNLANTIDFGCYVRLFQKTGDKCFQDIAIDMLEKMGFFNSQQNLLQQLENRAVDISVLIGCMNVLLSVLQEVKPQWDIFMITEGVEK